MTNNNDPNKEIESALNRLAKRDRDAAPDDLIASLSKQPTQKPRRSPLARIAPWALAAAAALAVAIPLITPTTPQPTPTQPSEPLALEDTLDAAWLLGEDITSLDQEIAEIAATLTTAANFTFQLDPIGDNG